MPLISGISTTGTNFKSDRVKLPVNVSDPASAAAGDIYYNTSTNNVRVYDGSTWSNL
tara:strand:- start:610 stop:780 length:171 start_codon:yes stop_codon:yes gene_type:complete